ncbi:MAG: carbon-nitrogen hydrolase family protein [Pseudomonadota bacterium]
MQYRKVAVAQVGSALFDTPASLEKCALFARDAAAGGAELVVFPEAFIGGYPKGVHFGAPVGSRSPEGREMFRRYYDGAIDAHGAEAARLAEIAGDLSIDMVVGVVERAGADEGARTLYCSVFCFSKDGAFLGKRRKVMPTAAERVIWGAGDGSTLDLFRTEKAKVSALICWENFMPMMRMNQYAQGAEVYCAPTVDDRESWTALMRVAALEGRCFVLCASQFMRRDNAPADYEPVQGTAPETVLINGGSVIVSPLGEILAGPVFGEEALLFADVDDADITRGKMDFDAAGHYARADIFQLSVDRSRKKPVI